MTKTSVPRVAASAAVAAATTLLLSACSGIAQAHTAPGHSASTTGTPPAISLRNGELVYTPDARGDQIPDYATAGYRGGATSPPSVPVKAHVAGPSGGDDTAAIQQAVNQVAALPPNAQGLRGTVLLGPGKYTIAGTVHLTASGVVLRGSLNHGGTPATTLAASGKAHSLIVVGGSGNYQQTGGTYKVSDSYVPIGATSFHLASTSGLKVGDTVIVQHPQTQAWINAVNMGTYWKPGAGLLAARTITAIHGDQVHIDAPLTTALDSSLGGGTVWHYTLPGQVDNVGVEDLAADATAFTQDPGYAQKSGGKSANSPEFHATFIQWAASRDTWAQNVTASHFGSSFNVGPTASRVTITKADSLSTDASLKVAPPTAFKVAGQQVLVSDCQVSGDHLHAWATEAWNPGPNVFTHCTATADTPAGGDGYINGGPHQRWGSGTLFDDLKITGTTNSSFDVINDGTGGTGHGWEGASDMFWNDSAAKYSIEQPATAYNWAYGVQGKKVPGKHHKKVHPTPAPGVIVGPGTPVQPHSLYQQQLSESHNSTTSSADTR
ncbi:peptidoglycan-binding protein [Streptantibioticus ferralitis]|uniref:Peptidoglycan-binding protein n=1 Tax=Streptantibioticus ferralitis TaxID=236510 RepID=A0ABT5YWK6_9ACTN|nr:peptidoglycan-binding protein [Streptantibioticus ferralitis]MDF2255966.1 peptidoglycan-binding protein [Streptantibioticus ferralitis]